MKDFAIIFSSLERIDSNNLMIHHLSTTEPWEHLSNIVIKLKYDKEVLNTDIK